MQMTMILDHCTKCKQPIGPGEPAMQTASVDIIDGRVVSSTVKSYHLKGDCPNDAQRSERGTARTFNGDLPGAGA